MSADLENPTTPLKLPVGIVPVLQTPFNRTGGLDTDGLLKLIESALRGGAAGFVAPAVASETGFLSHSERQQLVGTVAQAVNGRVPFIIGASSEDPEECKSFARSAEQLGASAYLVAVPAHFYECPEQLPGFFQSIAAVTSLPLIIQDLQWHGPGLEASVIARLKELLPTLAGIKIETIPAGPKYTKVREVLGPDFFIAGGWAITQMIEALDRRVDALIPESSMITVYSAIWRAHSSGRRSQALDWFRRLVPILAFTNQEIGLSIAFFKRLLTRKGIFQNETMRQPWVGWDTYNQRIADELIDLYLALEKEILLACAKPEN